MAIPTATDIKKMDYAFGGQPFVSVPLSNIDTTKMDYAFQGLPFVVNNDATGSSGPAGLKTWNGLAKSSLKTLNGLALASTKTWSGLA